MAALFFDDDGAVTTDEGTYVGSLALEGMAASAVATLARAGGRRGSELCIDAHAPLSQAAKVERMAQLRALPQPEQRSPEWFAMRETRLTASDLGGAIGDSKYDKPYDILLKKLGGGRPFTGNVATQWGQKYEPVATAVYELRNGVHVEEFGLLPHPTIPFLAASPDGIVSEAKVGAVPVGTMLEIKCPHRRKITGVVPKHYWIQMQLQLEVAQLDECDFMELTLVEYPDEGSYHADAGDREWLRADGNEKGLVLEVWDIVEAKFEYRYPKIDATWAELCAWRDEQTAAIAGAPTKQLRSATLWGIQVLSCVRVQRDRAWFMEKYPRMLAFWQRVCYYRAVGLEHLYADYGKAAYKDDDDADDAPVATTAVAFLSDSDTETPKRRAYSAPPEPAKAMRVAPAYYARAPPPSRGRGRGGRGRVQFVPVPLPPANVGFLSDSD